MKPPRILVEARVGFTYHKVNGYAPIFATLGTNGFQLANELRRGGSVRPATRS